MAVNVNVAVAVNVNVRTATNPYRSPHFSFVLKTS
jgi:hypothetical protein